jgi:hypothetical protein
MKERLKFFKKRMAVSDRPWQDITFEAERREETRRLAHVPLNRMHPECSVRDVRGSQILAAWQQILDAHWNQRAKGNLERPTPKVKVAGAAGARMQIDPVAADADRVRKDFRTIESQRMRDVLLDHSELGLNAAGFLCPRLATESSSI